MSAEDEFDIDEEVQKYLDNFQYYPKDAVQLMTFSKERTGKKRRYSDVNRSLRQWISSNRDLYESRSPFLSTDSEVVNAYHKTPADSSSASSTTASSYATSSSSSSSYSKSSEPEWRTLDECEDWDWDRLWADYIRKYDTHPKKAVHLWNHCKELRIRLKYSEARTEYPKLKARLVSGEDKAMDDSDDLSSAASSSYTGSSRKHHRRGGSGGSSSKLLATPEATAEFRKMSATGIYISKVDRTDVKHKEKVFALEQSQFESFWRAYMLKYQLNPGFPKNLYVFINETFPEIISLINSKERSQWSEYEEKMDDLGSQAQHSESKHYTYKAVNNAFKRWSSEMREKCADLLCKKKERRQSVVNASAISDLVRHVASEESGRTVSESRDTITEDASMSKDEALSPDVPIIDDSGDKTPMMDAKDTSGEDELVSGGSPSSSSFSAGRKAIGDSAEEEQNEEEDDQDDEQQGELVDESTTAVPTGSSDNQGELTPPDSPPQPSEEEEDGLAGGVDQEEEEEDEELSDLEAADESEDSKEEGDPTEDPSEDASEQGSDEEDAASEGAEGTAAEKDEELVIQQGIDLTEQQFRVILKGYKAEFGADRLPDSASQLVKWANGKGHQIKFGAVKRAMSYFT